MVADICPTKFKSGKDQSTKSIFRSHSSAANWLICWFVPLLFLIEEDENLKEMFLRRENPPESLQSFFLIVFDDVGSAAHGGARMTPHLSMEWTIMSFQTGYSREPLGMWREGAWEGKWIRNLPIGIFVPNEKNWKTIELVSIRFDTSLKAAPCRYEWKFPFPNVS